MTAVAETSAPTRDRAGLGIVVIGRNEGDRLDRCLRSLLGQSESIVYVDSGSTDGSIAVATQLGALVERLGLTHPFTAARARNAGVMRLQSELPSCRFVQFVDGDCQVDAGWLSNALAFLAGHEEVAAVCGRRRERFPNQSIYNLLCDLEWATPIGEAKACGGDVLMRMQALRQVGGYRDDLIAGEEPELCVRLRAKGWRIWRLDAEMTLHDAAMTKFSQWWKRCMRAGFAYAEGVRLHGAPPERHWVRESQSAWLWGAVLPLAVVLAAVLVHPAVLALLLVYPLQVLRLGLRSRGPAKPRWARAMFLVLGKFPEAIGQMKSALLHATRQRAALIEYK